MFCKYNTIRSVSGNTSVFVYPVYYLVGGCVEARVYIYVLRVPLGAGLRAVSAFFGLTAGGDTCSGPGTWIGVAIGFRSACARAGWSPIYIRRLDELASKCWLASRYSSVSLRE